MRRDTQRALAFGFGLLLLILAGRALLPSAGEPEAEYALVLDAGSSGTRMWGPLFFGQSVRAFNMCMHVNMCMRMHGQRRGAHPTLRPT
jgi:hypothetical protein